MEKLLEILSIIKPGVDFTKSNSIVDEGLLSSMDIARLVGEIDDEFDIEIEITDLVPENFNSVSAMMKMIERLEEED
jgi:acyl carrier protein